jgi:hypothetical protein
MMKLLEQTRPTELPTEALLARLRCRRATLALATAPATETPAANVVCWVYQRLNKRLRKRLEPFLDLMAMRSLVLTLRYTLVGEVAPVALLKNSLLAEALQQLLATTEDAETIVAQLEAALVKDYPFVAGLTVCYGQQGPGGVEQQLAEGILRHGLDRPGNDLINAVLSYLVDMRNCLMIHKLWRWQVTQAPPLTAGGNIATTGLQRIWATHDEDRLASVTTRLAGEPLFSAKTVAMEQCLLKGLTRLLRRAGRDPLGLAVIIEYLWRAQLATHNQLLRQTLAVDREELLEEVLLL